MGSEGACVWGNQEGKEEGGKGREERTGGDTLDAAAAGETTDGGFGDALDVVAEDLAVTLCAAFAEAFATFTAWKGWVLAGVLCMERRGGSGVLYSDHGGD